MKTLALGIFVVACYLAPPLAADVVILKDGSSYSGQLGKQNIVFTGIDGVGFTFPSSDVQSLVFTPTADTITLTSGKNYTGRYTGEKELTLAGAEGVQYRFPVSDIASLVLTPKAHPAEAKPDTHVVRDKAAKVIPEGTQITVTTNERIDSKSAEDGQLFAATIGGDVRDKGGATAIPSGSPAKLVVRALPSDGGSPPELVLDLYSVRAGDRTYRTLTTNVVRHGRDSIGSNRRTAVFLGGGSGLGALLGGVFGGGRGAGIGALAGGGSGALTQLFTRGGRIVVPAEATLTFRLDRTLVLREIEKNEASGAN